MVEDDRNPENWKRVDFCAIIYAQRLYQSNKKTANFAINLSLQKAAKTDGTTTDRNG